MLVSENNNIAASAVYYRDYCVVFALRTLEAKASADCVCVLIHLRAAGAGEHCCTSKQARHARGCIDRYARRVRACVNKKNALYQAF